MRDCNCDIDFVCESCLPSHEAMAEQMRWEYVRFGVPNESGKMVDVRDMVK